MSGTDYLTGLKGKWIPSEAGISIYRFLDAVGRTASVCDATGGVASLASWQGRPIIVDSAFPACQKEQKGIDCPPQRTFPGLQSQLDVSLPVFCGICFPKMKLSPGKGAETDNNSDKVKVMLVGCGRALKGRVPFPIPRERCPCWRKLLLCSGCL